MKPSNILEFIAWAIIAFAMAACGNASQDQATTTVVAPATSGVLHAATEVVEALRAKDGKRLAQLVHPEKGVRFSPYAYVDVAGDRVLSRAQINTLWSDPQTYTWGFADGTGDPIVLTPAQYFKRFVMDRDFAHPSAINVNDDHASGNTANNAKDVYPTGTRVEFYIAPTPKRGESELDWAALRLVFEQVAGSWFLIAVIHDEWTT